MTTPLLLFAFAVTLALQTVPAAGQPYTYEAKVIESSNGTCPTAEDREAVRNEIREEIRMLLRNITESLPTTYTCGGTDGWTRIAYLDMSNSSHQCPGDFREVTFEGIRLCARDSRADSSFYICTSVTFPTNGTPYSSACGRVVGYHYGATTAFGPPTTLSLPPDGTSIDGNYVAGVSLTHGPVGAREHIWTFAAGVDESPDTIFPQFACPCAHNGSTTPPPSFVGENYFCESGVHTFPEVAGFGMFFNNPLWDGDGCSEGNSCCTFNNPPYFTRQLPANTTDNIELRDCVYDYGIGGINPSDVFIQFIELYVK